MGDASCFMANNTLIHPSSAYKQTPIARVLRAPMYIYFFLGFPVCVCVNIGRGWRNTPRAGEMNTSAEPKTIYLRATGVSTSSWKINWNHARLASSKSTVLLVLVFPLQIQGINPLLLDSLRLRGNILPVIPTDI